MARRSPGRPAPMLSGHPTATCGHEIRATVKVPEPERETCRHIYRPRGPTDQERPHSRQDPHPWDLECCSQGPPKAHFLPPFTGTQTVTRPWGFIHIPHSPPKLLCLHPTRNQPIPPQALLPSAPPCPTPVPLPACLWGCRTPPASRGPGHPKSNPPGQVLSLTWNPSSL